MTFFAPRTGKKSMARRLILGVCLPALAFAAPPLRAQSEPVAPNNDQPAAPVVTVSKPASPAPTETAPPAQAGGAMGAANGDYILKPGDTIDLVVLNAARMASSVSGPPAWPPAAKITYAPHTHTHTSARTRPEGANRIASGRQRTQTVRAAGSGRRVARGPAPEHGRD